MRYGNKTHYFSCTLLVIQFTMPIIQMCSWTKQEQASCNPNNLSLCELLSLIFWGLSGNGGIPADVKTWMTY